MAIVLAPYHQRIAPTVIKAAMNQESTFPRVDTVTFLTVGTSYEVLLFPLMSLRVFLM